MSGSKVSTPIELKSLPMSNMTTPPSMAVGGAEGEECRVLSYNINILPFGMRLQPAHDYKDDRLSDFIDAIAPERQSPPAAPLFDVLLLQEVYSSPYVPKLARAKLCRQQRMVALLKERGFEHHAVPKQPSVMGMLSRLKATDTGLVIVSRFPISERASHVLRSSGSPRGVLFAKVDLPGGSSMLCFSVRLTTGLRASDLAEVRQFISGIAHRFPSCPVVLGGDFGINSILQPAQRDAYGFIYDGSTQQSPAYEELLRHIDRQQRLQDVVLDAYGQHVPTRPPDAGPMELDDTLAGQQHTARTDFLFVSKECIVPNQQRAATPVSFLQPLNYFSVSASYLPAGNGAPEQAEHITCRSTEIMRFPAPDSRPYKYLSDHFGIAATVVVPASLRTRRPVNALDDNAAAPHQLAGTHSANGGRDLKPRLTAFIDNIRRGHTVNDFVVSAWEVVLLLVLYWLSKWAAASFAFVYAALILSQRMFPREPPEEPFGVVTERVKAGVSAVEVIGGTQQADMGSGSLKLHLSPTAPAAGSLPTATSVATFGVAWRTALRNRPWVNCIGRIEDSAAGTPQVQWLTVEDVDRLAAWYGRGLRSLGLTKGSRLAVLADPSPDAAIIDIACLLTGIVTVPLSGDLATMRCQLQAARCSVCVTSRTRLEQLLDTRAASLTAAVLVDSAAASPSALAQTDRLKHDAADRGLRLITVKELSDLGQDGPASIRVDLRSDDVATILCDVGEEVPIGVERQVSLRIVDQRHFMAMVHQIDACRILGKDAPPPLEQRSAAHASGSQHRLDRRSSKPATTTLDAPSARAQPLKNALFPGGGCLLIHRGFSDLLERVASIAASLIAFRVVHARSSQSLFDDCRIVQPTVVFVSPGTLHNVRAQIEGNLSKRQRWYTTLFRIAFAARLRLQGRSRDSWAMRLFFSRTEAMFGSRLTTLVVPTLEHVSFKLRDFAAVCFTPRIREVAFVQDCGIICVNGIPPPNTLVRIVDCFSESQPDSAFDSGAGEITVSGPAVLPDAKSSTGWAHSGIVGSWRGLRLSAICPRDGLLWPMMNVSVAAPQLEREYLAGSRMSANLFLTCKPLRPLVAVVVPRREAVEEVAQQQGMHGVAQLPWPEFARIAKPLIVQDLERVAREFKMPFAHLVRGVHLHPHPFAQHSSFFSQHRALRRNRVARYFENAIDSTYSELGRQHTHSSPETRADSPASLGAATIGGRRNSVSPLPSPSPGLSGAPQYSAQRQRRQAVGEPRSFHLCPRAPFAIDIGGTCAKIAYFQPPRHSVSLPPYCEDETAPEDMRNLFAVTADSFFSKESLARMNNARPAEDGAEVGSLRFMRLPTNRVSEFLSYLQDTRATRIFKDNVLTELPATGGGAQKFSAAVASTFSNQVSLLPVKEMESIIRGMQLCIESAQDCIFSYDFRDLVRVPHRLSVTPSTGIYPFMVVNIGSGVSIVKCPAPNVPYVRVGGTPVGGGTFWGLARALTNVRTWDEVKELTRLDGPGDHTNVDLLVGDIYGFNARDLPPRLTVDTVASCFGKLGTSRLEHESDGHRDSAAGSRPQTPQVVTSPVLSFPQAVMPAPDDLVGGSFPRGPGNDADANEENTPGHGSGRQPQPVDIIRSLLMMVATNVTQIAHLVSQQEHVENIFFTGGFVRDNEVVWRHISRLTDYWSNSKRVAHFIESDGYLGVIGALAAASDAVPVGSDDERTREANAAVAVTG
jgi:pantothenate kinase